MLTFTICCKDHKTGLEMIATECSYNQACDYLEHKPLGRFIGVACMPDNNLRLRYEKRNFIYDERRAYLLGE